MLLSLFYGVRLDVPPEALASFPKGVSHRYARALEAALPPELQMTHEARLLPRYVQVFDPHSATPLVYLGREQGIAMDGPRAQVQPLDDVGALAQAEDMAAFDAWWNSPVGQAVAEQFCDEAPALLLIYDPETASAD